MAVGDGPESRATGTPGPGHSAEPTFHVVRAPSHLGDVIMALPVLDRLGVDVVVERPLDSLLSLAGLPGRTVGIDRGVRGFVSASGDLRRRRYRRGLLLKPSLSAALLFRAAGVAHLRGTATDGRGALLAEAVDPEPLKPLHRVEQFFRLAGLEPPDELAPHRLRIAVAELAEWKDRLGKDAERPLVGLFPGSNAPARRWDADRFNELAHGLAARGVTVIVFGGPSERTLTARVAEGVAGAFDAGGRTDLPGLAAALSLCTVLVTNDTGPMHLAGAVGTPTVTIWGSSSPHEVRPLGARDARARLEEPLPCMPCYRNHCPRAGKVGYRLERGENECLRLLAVEDVLEPTVAFLDSSGRP